MVVSLTKIGRSHFTFNEKRNLCLPDARKGHEYNIIVTAHKYHNHNLITKNFKLCDHIRQINPLCFTQKPKVLLRKNVPRSIVKQDHAPRRASAHNGYKRRPPEPSTSRIKITGSDKLRKTIKQEE